MDTPTTGGRNAGRVAVTSSITPPELGAVVCLAVFSRWQHASALPIPLALGQAAAQQSWGSISEVPPQINPKPGARSPTMINVRRTAVEARDIMPKRYNNGSRPVKTAIAGQV